MQKLSVTFVVLLTDFTIGIGHYCVFPFKMVSTACVVKMSFFTLKVGVGVGLDLDFGQSHYRYNVHADCQGWLHGKCCSFVTLSTATCDICL